jgi:hypothetical protein
MPILHKITVTIILPFAWYACHILLVSRPGHGQKQPSTLSVSCDAGLPLNPPKFNNAEYIAAYAVSLGRHWICDQRSGLPVGLRPGDDKVISIDWDQSSPLAIWYYEVSFGHRRKYCLTTYIKLAIFEIICLERNLLAVSSRNSSESLRDGYRMLYGVEKLESARI